MTPCKKSLRIALSALLILVGLEFIAILFLNDGHFVFTLDDPYIHLALAKNLLKGHYGINAGEFSSPSSSLLWPFLIAPFSGTGFGIYWVLFINVLSAAGTVFIFWKVLSRSLVPDAGKNKLAERFFPFILIALLFATNLIGLIYTGMEHSLQVFLSSLIVLGLIGEAERGTAPWWLFAAVLLAPCVRFECLALSLPALALLYFRGHRLKSILTAATLLGLIGGFGLFLSHLGLSPIPLSISAKSPFLISGRGFKTFYDVLHTNLSSFKGMLLLLGSLCLVIAAVSTGRKKPERALAGALAVAILLHLCAGQIGGYNRYEPYAVAVLLLSLLYFYKQKISAMLGKLGLCPAIALLFFATALLFFSYLKESALLPMASNNIYLQQYQMHRFAAEYYRKPVAVNDIGLVSYRNPNYVLDLWGLASKEAFAYRKKKVPAPEWIPKVAHDHNVQLVMIYDDWFFSKTSEGIYVIPAGWRKLGELKLERMKITPDRSEVSFYALTDSAAEEALPLLREFQKRCPKARFSSSPATS